MHLAEKDVNPSLCSVKSENQDHFLSQVYQKLRPIPKTYTTGTNYK